MLLVHAFLTFPVLGTSYYLRICIAIKPHFCFPYFIMLPHHSSPKLDRGCPHSYPDIAARFTDLPLEDHLHLHSLQARTLPPIKKPVPTSASNPTSQRVQTVPCVPVPTSPPSKQAKQAYSWCSQSAQS